MHLVSPDILADGRGLSVAVCAVGLVLGLVLWLLGGRAHRFWLVLLTTLAAGVYGLSIGEVFGVQPLVAGLLMGVAAGTLALSLVRLMAFLAGGVAACLLAERLTPGWDEPFVFFFVGGFLGLALVRYWMMALSSLAGTLSMAYSGLWLLDTLGRLDAVTWAADRPRLLDWACGGVTLLGVLVQIALERRWRRKQGSADRETGMLRKQWWWGSSETPRRNRRAA
jgi:hypothetical protein